MRLVNGLFADKVPSALSVLDDARRGMRSWETHLDASTDVLPGHVIESSPVDGSTGVASKPPANLNAGDLAVGTCAVY